MKIGETIYAPTLRQRLVCRRSTASTAGKLLQIELWLARDSAPIPPHVHPRQEERIEVLAGRLHAVSGGEKNLLGLGDTLVVAPGVAHSLSSAGPEEVGLTMEFRPALGMERFLEALFALDRAGGAGPQGNISLPRLAVLEPYSAESFLPGIPVLAQQALLRTLAWAGRRRPGAREASRRHTAEV